MLQHSIDIVVKNLGAQKVKFHLVLKERLGDAVAANTQIGIILCKETNVGHPHWQEVLQQYLGKVRGGATPQVEETAKTTPLVPSGLCWVDGRP